MVRERRANQRKDTVSPRLLKKQEILVVLRSGQSAGVVSKGVALTNQPHLLYSTPPPTLPPSSHPLRKNNLTIIADSSLLPRRPPQIKELPQPSRFLQVPRRASRAASSCMTPSSAVANLATGACARKHSAQEQGMGVHVPSFSLQLRT